MKIKHNLCFMLCILFLSGCLNKEVVDDVSFKSFGAFTLGASKQKVFLYIILPSCLTDIITGLRTTIGVTYAKLVAAEMVAATSGIG